MHICTYAHMHICTNAYMNVCTGILTHTHTHTHTHKHTHTHAHVLYYLPAFSNMKVGKSNFLLAVCTV